MRHRSRRWRRRWARPLGEKAASSNEELGGGRDETPDGAAQGPQARAEDEGSKMAAAEDLGNRVRVRLGRKCSDIILEFGSEILLFTTIHFIYLFIIERVYIYRFGLNRPYGPRENVPLLTRTYRHFLFPNFLRS